MATTMVVVAVPDGVYEGHEFVLEYGGQQLTVCCPDGCGPGDEINLEVPAGDEDSSTGAAPPPNLVDVAVPDGCCPGMEFTVEFEGRSFNITVPDGVNAGEMLTVEVPAAEDAPSPAPEPKQPAPGKQKMQISNMEIPAFRGGSSASQAPKREKLDAAKYLDGLDIPAYRGPMKGVTANSVNAHAKWAPATNLFDMGPDQGYGRAAGDFKVGQLVQVLRSNGSWTYAKMMDYDPLGDVYSVMTKAGPKYFVERDDITLEVVENPSGGCAHQ